MSDKPMAASFSDPRFLKWLTDLPVMLLFASLPFSIKISNILIAVSAGITILLLIKERQLPRLHFFWFLPVLFMYYGVSEFFSGGLWSSMEKRLLYLIIPLIFAFQPYSQNAKRIKWAFVTACLLSLIVCLLRAAILSSSFEQGEFLFNPRIEASSEYDFFTSSVMGGNYFFAKEFSWFMHPTYAALCLVLAQYNAFDLAFSSRNKAAKWSLIVCYLIFALGIFLLSSKAIIITSLLLMVGLLFFLTIKMPLGRTTKFALIAGTLVTAGLFIILNPRLKVFENNFVSGLTINPNARFGHDLRMLSWNASLELIREHPFFGVGEGRKESSLVSVYLKKKYVVPAQERFNSHNQYLDVLLGGGIFFLCLFLTGIVQMLMRSIQWKDHAFLIFILIFLFNGLFENILSIHVGVLIFCVFVSYWNTYKQH